jgi:hypothetical protein
MVFYLRLEVCDYISLNYRDSLSIWAIMDTQTSRTVELSLFKLKESPFLHSDVTFLITYEKIRQQGGGFMQTNKSLLAYPCEK